MKKKKINYFIVEVDLYKVDVLVVVGDIGGAIEWLSNKNVTDSDIESIKSNSNDQGNVLLLSNNAIYLHVRDREKTNFWTSVLVHEVFHAASFLLKSKGIELDESSEEAYAYLIEFIYYKIMEQLDELKIK